VPAGSNIVVGVDGSAGAEVALRFAVEEATLRCLPLRLVCAWEAGAAAYMGEVFAPTADVFVDAEQHADQVLRAAVELAGALGVQVEALAVEGHPATMLIEQARDAALLVVGTRGHGTAASLLLGSVSQRLAHRAGCPLVIVPAADRPA
jgi:nucleotide-binding universal stress UspA family protein